jgi:hypothetical protein
MVKTAAERSAATRAWQIANPERARAIELRRRSTPEGLARINEARRALYRRQPSDYRWRNLRKLYRVTQECYDAQLARQDGRCAICRCLPEDVQTRPLFVDHDHTCCPKTPTCGGCNRGLLCGPCNVAMAAYDRLPGWADAAHDYWSLYA